MDLSKKQYHIILGIKNLSDIAVVSTTMKSLIPCNKVRYLIILSPCDTQNLSITQFQFLNENLVISYTLYIVYPCFDPSRFNIYDALQFNLPFNLMTMIFILTNIHITVKNMKISSALKTYKSLTNPSLALTSCYHYLLPFQKPSSSKN